MGCDIRLSQILLPSPSAVSLNNLANSQLIEAMFNNGVLLLGTRNQIILLRLSDLSLRWASQFRYASSHATYE